MAHYTTCVLDFPTLFQRSGVIPLGGHDDDDACLRLLPQLLLVTL